MRIYLYSILITLAQQRDSLRPDQSLPEIKLEYYPSLRSPYSAIAHAEVEHLTTTTQANWCCARSCPCSCGALPRPGTNSVTF